MMQQQSEPVVLLAPSASLFFKWLGRIIHVDVVFGLQILNRSVFIPVVLRPLITACAVDYDRTIFQDITCTNSVTNDIEPVVDVVVGNNRCQLTG